MQITARPILLIAVVCLMAACNVPDTTMENGAITLRGDTVTLHVDGKPKAVIDADGSFIVDGKTIATTPAERQLLTRYVDGVRGVHATGVAMGKTGIGMAAKAVMAAASSSSTATDKAADADSDHMTSLSRQICMDTASIKAAQDQLAAQLDAFRPYAGIVAASDVADCQSNNKN